MQVVFATSRTVRHALDRRSRPHPAPRYPARRRQSARRRPLSRRVVGRAALDPARARCQERRQRRPRDPQLRAAGRARQDRRSRRGRSPCRAHRRLAAAIRLRAARVRYPPRAAPRFEPDPLSHRRRHAQGVRAADAGDDCGDRAHQDSRAHGRRRETPSAGWPHQDALARRPRGGIAPVDHADRVRRKSRDAHLRPGHRGQGIPPARLCARRGKDLARAGRASARHRAGHRPDRFGQDDDAVFDAESAGDARHQRVHGRRPDRNGLARVQPDAGARRRSISISRPACARCCARIRTSSWSAKSAISKPRRWRCRPR